MKIYGNVNSVENGKYFDYYVELSDKVNNKLYYHPTYVLTGSIWKDEVERSSDKFCYDLPKFNLVEIKEDNCIEYDNGLLYPISRFLEEMNKSKEYWNLQSKETKWDYLIGKECSWEFHDCYSYDLRGKVDKLIPTRFEFDTEINHCDRAYYLDKNGKEQWVAFNKVKENVLINDEY